ncbi:TPT-domain-containing protein [Violaceomyces palustris]|uniref:TPT-domain-containing protein n=1 Tax=Violaceomyces palustris TaxID=1673888 RepID=A0ACD0NN55_9BASI|nr:TPT-domain-containing protein [Violaceomyces palustris]
MTRSYHGGDEDQGYEALVRSRSSSSSVRTASIAARERRTAYWRSAVVNLLLIASWYMFSTLISVYNKWMFSKGHYNFSYPLFVTSCHMVMQFGLSSIALSLCDRKLIPRRHNGTRARPSGYDWISKVVPCGLATALDIGLSNSSLKTITLSFYTMCKSSNLAFVLFFAFLFRLEVVRISLIGIIGLITAGVVMMVASETKFELVGAIQVLTASAMGGLRWALTQMLLDRDNLGMNNPIATIFWLAPVMALSLCTFSLVFESWSEIFRGPFFHGLTRSIKTMGLIAAPGVLAFGMNLSEFALIQRTSVVTLSVAGIFKEVLTISLASVIFGDELTPINITGLCITLLGIALYNWLKYRLITKGVNVVSRSGGSTTTTSGAGGHSTLGYTPLSNQDGEEEEGRRGNLQEEEVGQEGSSAILLGLSGGNKGQEVSEEEKERRRKREEEADLDGWERSGSKVTGNGWVDGSESD